jgi:osmotically-inducible protein OsmY
MKQLKRNPVSVLVCLAAAASVLEACTPIGFATGAAATTGVAAAREGGIRRTLTDLEIQAAINDLWFRYSIKTFAELDMTVNEGRVLITGVVQNPEDRVEAVRLAWQPEGVKQVINEIQLADSPGITDYARDAWISTRLRTALTFDSKVQSINYSIDVVKGNVYLMGIAQNQTELNHVIEKARTIPDVKRVVSYVKLAGESIGPTQGGETTAQEVQ